MRKYPNKVMAIRYEDLSLNLYGKTEEILKFYGLPFHYDVKKFLASHRAKNDGDAYSTYRNSKTTPFHWMRELSFDEIQRIQSQCTDAMSLWGYKAADDKDEDDLLDGAFNPLLKSPFESN